jgi:hypothetical protein
MTNFVAFVVAVASLSCANPALTPAASPASPPPAVAAPAAPTLAVAARTPPTLAAAAPNGSDSIILTVFLRHDQSRSLPELQQIQDEQGFWKAFPPAGTTVVSWHVLMGIGQVVTLMLPASKLRDVNVAIERTAWKAFHTEFYATYDLWPVIKDKLPNAHKLCCEECGR